MYLAHHRRKRRASLAGFAALALVGGLFVVLPLLNHLDTHRLRTFANPSVATMAPLRVAARAAAAASETSVPAPPAPVPALDAERTSDTLPVHEVAKVPELEPMNTALEPGNLLVFEASELDFDPVPFHRMLPEYPVALRRDGIEGNVVVVFRVDTSGAVIAVEVESTTHPEFTASVVHAVLQWRFMPGTIEGKAVNFRIRQPVEFHIDPNATDADSRIVATGK
jgi:TonB family protein